LSPCEYREASRLADVLGQRDEDALRAADVTQAVLVLVLDHFANEFGAVGTTAGKDILDVVDGKLMRPMPSVFAGAVLASTRAAFGVWNFDSSSRLCRSGVRIIAMSARTPSRPTTRSTQLPSTVVSPSSSRPRARKKATAAARSSTTIPTLSIR